MRTNRRDFMWSLGKAVAGAAGLTWLAACGGGGGGNNTPDAPSGNGNCLANGTNVSISANHGHVLVVSKDDVAAGTAKTYDIMGTANHNHQVTLTAGNFTTLAANNGVMTVSTTNSSHSHEITIMCV